LQVVFDSVSRTQRFAFQAHAAPIQIFFWRFSGCEPLVSGNKPRISTYRTPFTRQTTASSHRLGLPLRAETAPCSWENVTSHGKRDCWKGQTGAAKRPRKRTVIGTLLLSNMGLTNVTKKPGVGCAAL
jgi:hypothetical protein